jgi:hypothetical protein
MAPQPHRQQTVAQGPPHPAQGPAAPTNGLTQPFKFLQVDLPFEAEHQGDGGVGHRTEAVLEAVELGEKLFGTGSFRRIQGEMGRRWDWTLRAETIVFLQDTP